MTVLDAILSRGGPFARRVRFGLALAASVLLATPALASSALIQIAHNEVGRTQQLQLAENKSLIVDLPVGAGEVIVSQPDIANAIMRTRTRAVIQGVSAGETNMFFLDPDGSAITILDIRVLAPEENPVETRDSVDLARTINRLIPGANVQVDSFEDNVVLSGTVPSGADQERALDIATQFAGGGSIADLLEVQGGQQVMLKVTVAEVKREVAREFGINLSASFGGGLATSVLTDPAEGGLTNDNVLSADFSVGNASIQAALKALERQDAVELLAEPVLTAMSGTDARFQAGGELPIRTTDNDGNETVEFKQFGIELDFTPTVMADRRIGLVVGTSVSEPQLDGTLNTREASTTVELGAGQTLAIAGLIEERTRQQINEIPGVGNIPIIGALFRSREFVNTETELLILVTPILATATDREVPLPTDSYVASGDAEAIFLGRMEKLYGVGEGERAGSLRGSVGFVLD